MAFSPDGKTLASGGDADKVTLWDVATAKKRGAIGGHKGGVYSLAFSPDGKTLATGGMDRTVRLWDSATGEQTGVLHGNLADANGLAFSPDGKRLASAWGEYLNNLSGEILIWPMPPTK